MIFFLFILFFFKESLNIIGFYVFLLFFTHIFFAIFLFIFITFVKVSFFFLNCTAKQVFYIFLYIFCFFFFSFPFITSHLKFIIIPLSYSLQKQKSIYNFFTISGKKKLRIFIHIKDFLLGFLVCFYLTDIIVYRFQFRFSLAHKVSPSNMHYVCRFSLFILLFFIRLLLLVGFLYHFLKY